MSRLALLLMAAAVVLSACVSDHGPGSSYYRDGYYGGGYAGDGYYRGGDYGGGRYRVKDSYRYQDTSYRPPRVRQLPLLRPVVRPSRR
ncbi:hypothetical protein [Reyranella sp. CPCC 100927]|uniref:hypothetical protein n=1 Tax=Reyranella sp. CPCC 100927 TaxID=2599616 RepID=UPI0011B456B3|nr:hypothetical protein [Reyranella sp. CPCC 100927]TWT13890.1 hypothetical protein FQU96_08250 [Reyranella sp. CPCC 100927]